MEDLSIGLLELPDAQLDEIEMEDTLRDALRALKGIRSNEAHRRQTQYVRKLMRQANPEPLRQAIAAHRAGRTQDALAFQEIERWRERLLADDTALTAWIEVHPATDVRQLRTLIRNARRDLAIAQVADAGSDAGKNKGRAYRELFKDLRAALQTADANQAAANPSTAPSEQD